MLSTKIAIMASITAAMVAIRFTLLSPVLHERRIVDDTGPFPIANITLGNGLCWNASQAILGTVLLGLGLFRDPAH